MPGYRVQCCTYNGHLSKGSPEVAVAEWLGPTLDQTHQAGGNDKVNPPDFVAVGFQVSRRQLRGARGEGGLSAGY